MTMQHYSPQPKNTPQRNIKRAIVLPLVLLVTACASTPYCPEPVLPEVPPELMQPNPLQWLLTKDS